MAILPQYHTRDAIQGWLPASAVVQPWSDRALAELLARVRQPVTVVADGEDVRLGTDAPTGTPGGDSLPVTAWAAGCAPERLGEPSWTRDYGTRYACYGGSMANGISSVTLVEALGRAGMLGFFGAAGLGPAEVEAAIDQLQRLPEDVPYGCNLIHSPNESALEAAVADLYVRRGVRCVEASAYLRLTLPVVRYRVTGIEERPDGSIVTPHHVIAKVSRVEVASKFLAPPPEDMLSALVAAGDITEAQAALAARIPVARDLTAEADSGGHTDRRPALALLPTMIALRDRFQTEHGYAAPPRVGLAGGISTPASAAAAFAMGAAYIVTGSVNQACVESGSSNTVRRMLAEAGQADIAMAPAADMFEMGVDVQVLKRGTMFAMRGAKLYQLYKQYPSLDALPAEERARLEKQIFQSSTEDFWAQTRAFWMGRDPAQVERAEKDPRHKMALLFRAYLGQASRWANQGVPERKLDYQVWCGPAMGAFNEWVRGTFLEAPEQRHAATVGLNILYGAAVLHRANQLRTQGVYLPPAATRIIPRHIEEIEEYLR